MTADHLHTARVHLERWEELMAGRRTTEQQISMAVLRILAEAPDGVASIRRIKKLIPDYIQLTEGDKQPSLTRRGEELWEQIVRNIVSHKEASGNFIAEGYLEHRPRHLKITQAGRTRLKRS